MHKEKPEIYKNDMLLDQHAMKYTFILKRELATPFSKWSPFFSSARLESTAARICTHFLPQKSSFCHWARAERDLCADWFKSTLTEYKTNPAFPQHLKLKPPTQLYVLEISAPAPLSAMYGDNVMVEDTGLKLVDNVVASWVTHNAEVGVFDKGLVWNENTIYI